ncbi:GMC oxidoreductase [Ulvibacterium marinum]|uniref:GMC oxidoreductase n=1 Tax=Ulvibacterium marinum TaxID=2419782 RepID=UPI002493F6AB|nr:GMC oxidoreductase [Ulvibacterium marinum]
MEKIRATLCVVGAGPAGIITALEFSHKNPEKKVVLVEFGKKESKGIYKNSLDESIKFNDPSNLHGVYESTNKGLGGSTLTWGGRCVSYDEVDFLDRPIVNNGCTWNISIFDDVKKYMERASFYFESGSPVFNLKEINEFLDFPIADNFIEGDVTDRCVERWSMPTRFGKKYRQEIEVRSNIVLLEGYEARDFDAADKEGKISSLCIRSKLRELRIEADHFVISSGTQESTRLLLRNKQVFKNLKKVPSALGKYYQGHVSGKIASVKFYGNPKNTDYGFILDKDGVYLRRRFQFSKDYLVANNLLNTAIWLDNPLYHKPEHKSGAMSFMYLAMITPFLKDKLAPPAIADSVTKGHVGDRKKHLINVVQGLPGSIVKPAVIFYKRFLLKRKLPGIFLYSPKNTYALHFHSEQVPFEGNQMYLDKDNETLVVDYTLLKNDIESVIKSHKKLDEYLRQSNCGELLYWYPKKDLFSKIKNMSRDGIHQSGTTRIGKDEKEGVVDTDLKVFGTSNLYICSSSVFPTSGQANPTFMLGAFAARLSHHLSGKS